MFMFQKDKFLRPFAFPAPISTTKTVITERDPIPVKEKWQFVPHAFESKQQHHTHVPTNKWQTHHLYENLPTVKQNPDDNVRYELNKMLRYLNKIASHLICQFVQNALQPETNKLWTILEAGTTQRRTSERMGYCLQRDNSASQHLAKRTKQGNPCSTTACLSMCTKITKQTTYIAWPPP